jgi:hypothetical protein
MRYANRSVVAAAALLALLAAPLDTASQPAGIALAMNKHAVLRSDGVVVLRLQVICGPFTGAEDFQQGFAGGSQPRTGAASEGGIDGTVVCDGVEREHTAHLPSYTGFRFRPGPANFSAAINLCMLVGDEQQCYNGAISRRVIIRPGGDK